MLAAQYLTTGYMAATKIKIKLNKKVSTQPHTSDNNTNISANNMDLIVLELKIELVNRLR